MYKKTVISLLLIYVFFFPFSTSAEENQRFCFVVMGCLHLGVTDLDDYQLAIEKIKQYQPDFVLFLGGMIEPLEETSIKSLWQAFDQLNRTLEVPVYNLSGDCFLLPLSVSEDRKSLMEQCFLERFEKPYYSFAHKKNLFLCLDSKNKEDLFSGEELKFLKDNLADTSNYNHVFIAVHHSPLYQGRDKWLEIIHPLIQNKVDCVFGAHQHFFNLTKIKNVNYITTGYPPLREPLVTPPLLMEESFFHFLVVTVEGKEPVSIKVVPVQLTSPERFEKKEGATSRPAFLHAQPEFKSYVIGAKERSEVLEISQVVKTLNIKPGMAILDIGAGTGLFTFPLAEALKGRGSVFATDIDKHMIDYMQKKISGGGYKNIFPVQVSSEGVDPFYKKHSFDIIFLSEVYDGLLHPEDYFRELRPSLKKKGRLYIIHCKNISPFSQMEFGNFKNALKILKSKGEDFPVFKRLSKEVQEFITGWQGNEEVPPLIQKAMVGDFNQILEDRWFLNDLFEYNARKQKPGRTSLFEEFFHPPNVRLAKWLYINLEEAEVFNRRKKRLTDEREKRELCLLNRMLLSGIFQTDKLNWVSTRRTTVEKKNIISTLEAAGYSFIREYEMLTHHYFLEFKRRF